MTFSSSLGLALLASIFAASTVACSSEQGPGGPPGPQGAPGTPGPQGSIGPPGDAAFPTTEAGVNTGCTAPCHGFGNVVEQWKYSKHFIMNAQAADEPAWTSAGSCGNCHAIDGLERRLAQNVAVADGGVPTSVAKGHLNYQVGAAAPREIGYSGAGKTAVVHCATCHEFTPKNDPHNTGKYIPGSAPLRVASGADDTVMIEKSPEDAGTSVGQPAGKYKAGNTCVMCHKSRKDVTFYITAANTMSSAHWGPHEGPQTDVFSGLGGYHLPGVTYGTSTHTTVANGCTSCHMPNVATNQNVPDHSMHPAIAYCKSCHTTYTGTTFDIQSGQSTVRAALRELEAALNAKGLLTRGDAAPYAALTELELVDSNFHLDGARPGSAPDGKNQVLDAATAGALYNYFLIARSKDFGVHNPTYEKQLLWDSIKTITGANPTSLPSRPS